MLPLALWDRRPSEWLVKRSLNRLSECQCKEEEALFVGKKAPMISFLLS